jgi:hypothetical protein
MSDKRFPANIISSTPVEPSGSFEDDAASGTWSLQEAFTYVKAGLWPTAGNQKPLIEDVFSTYLYTGNGSTQTITNGIDLAGEGGLVWFKARNSAQSNIVFDTERGANKSLLPESSYFEQTETNALMSFNSDGFTAGGYSGTNASSITYASWTFRKTPRFFDVATWTGDAVAGRTISHDLGVEPGCIIVKRLNGADNWTVYHRGIDASAPENYTIYLNTTEERADQDLWADTAPTDAVFSVGDNIKVNGSGSTYVAYLFAHDPLGPSGDGSDGLIACGSYTGNGSTDGPEIDLGWEPQWLLMKQTSTSGDDWYVVDSMRGFNVSGTTAHLSPNTSAQEFTTDAIEPRATGFKLVKSYGAWNSSGSNYIYIAIRRGPMRAPTSGTEVFAPVQFAEPQFTTGFPVDFAIAGNAAGTDKWYFQSRLQGAKVMSSASTAGELGSGSAKFDIMDGYGTGFSTAYYSTAFRRAPGFFDVVAYSGNSVAGRTVPHNLGVAPEMMIVKTRSNISNWAIYHSAIGPTKYLQLPGTQQANTSSQRWNDTSPAADVFTVGNDQDVNTSGWTYIAYLFATLAGVSKVGSYTGNGTSQTIDCGFTSGARFILIKRTDSTGDWYVWDSARGIVAGNDPHLSLNSTAAEVTTDDSVDAESSGFIVNQDAGTNVNVNTASYIFLAIA